MKCCVISRAALKYTMQNSISIIFKKNEYVHLTIVHSIHSKSKINHHSISIATKLISKMTCALMYIYDMVCVQYFSMACY